MDTRGSASPGRAKTSTLSVAIGVLLALACLCIQVASAAPRPINAKVVWADSSTAIIALNEPIVLDHGDRIQFLWRDKMIAEGSIAGTVEPSVAIVRLDSRGSLKPAKKLDRLKLLVERLSIATPTTLSVGYPTDGRANLLFRCGRMTLHAPVMYGEYRTDMETDHLFRLVRTFSVWAYAANFPDTLLIRLFDDSADEEIALERGELDFALFWPGEMSAHARGLSLHHSPAAGTQNPWARGLLAAVWLAPGPDDSIVVTTSDRFVLDRLGSELFGRDLSARSGGEVLLMRSSFPHFEMDHTCPGWQVLERFLNTRPASRARQSDGDTVWVFFLDAPPTDPRMIALALAERLRRSPVPPTIAALSDSLLREAEAPGPPTASYAFRLPGDHLSDQVFVRWMIPYCQLLPRPGSHMGRYVSEGGAEWLFDLLDCPPAGGR